MSRLIIGQITIKKERAISSTKWYYLLQPAEANPPVTTNYGNPPPTITDTGYSGWSLTEPSYTLGDNRRLYQLALVEYTDGSFEYSTPTLSSSYEASKSAYNEIIEVQEIVEEFEGLGLKQGYFWMNPTAKPAGGSIPAYPVGSYIASGINGTITQSNSNTYGLNTWISTSGINLRYNAIDLAKLTTSNLQFFYPATSTQGGKAISLGTHSGENSLIFYGFGGDSHKTMELTNTALTFYNPTNGVDIAAQLNTNGLNISNGSIILGGNGTSGVNAGDIALSNQDFIRTINNTSREHLRMAIGSKFGVKSDGTLYAAGAEIDGSIVARSLIINGTDYIGQVPEIQNKASNSAEYEVVIKVKSIDYTTPEATLIAIPTKLGASTTGTFVWYKNAIGTAHGGTVTTTTNADDTLTITDLDALYIAVLQ